MFGFENDVRNRHGGTIASFETITFDHGARPLDLSKSLRSLSSLDLPSRDRPLSHFIVPAGSPDTSSCDIITLDEVGESGLQSSDVIALGSRC